MDCERLRERSDIAAASCHRACSARMASPDRNAHKPIGIARSKWRANARGEPWPGTARGTPTPMTTILRGGCHCGNITVGFETALDPTTLSLRACQCSFCRRHGGVTTSGPAGRLVIKVRQAAHLQKYRFALGITDFLICRTCGMYVAAVMESDGRSLGVLNVNVLDEHAPFARPPTPMEYGAEAVEDREMRRAKVWMPVEMRANPGAGRS
jgi:hypothetical protein